MENTWSFDPEWGFHLIDFEGRMGIGCLIPRSVVEPVKVLVKRIIPELESVEEPRL